MISDAAVNEKHLQALVYLEREGEPPRGGFSGEKGLAYAYVLAERRYYRHALEQLDGLIKKEDPVTESLPFLLIDGFVAAKRRRYERSFQSYLRAGNSLVVIAPEDIDEAIRLRLPPQVGDVP
jgi:hypothetical protein